MSALSILLQAAIEERIKSLGDRSLNLNGDPYGSDSRHRVQAQHWVAYQGSSFPADTTPEGYPLEQEGVFSQARELEFQHYVEVEDLRRDFIPALQLHETLMGAIAGFRPNVEGVIKPFRLASDGVVSAKVDGETVYRYRATYRILCEWEAEPLEPPLSFTPTAIEYGLWRSRVDEVGADTSVKFAESKVEVEAP